MAYVVFEIVGGYILWILNSCRGSSKDFQTAPGDPYKKRFKNRVYGGVFLIIVFYIIYYIVKTT